MKYFKGIKTCVFHKCAVKNPEQCKCDCPFLFFRGKRNIIVRAGIPLLVRSFDCKDWLCIALLANTLHPQTGRTETQQWKSNPFDLCRFSSSPFTNFLTLSKRTGRRRNHRGYHNYFVFLCKCLIIITAMRDSLICSLDDVLQIY